MKMMELTPSDDVQKLIASRMREVLKHQQFINGPEVAQLETEMASFTNSKYAVGCSSGTDAILLALKALGVKPGDRIITVPFTFMGTIEPILLCGAIPVFVDVRADTFNLDTRKLEELLRFPGRFVGIIAVDLFGLPADYHEINRIAQKFGLWVIEDAAQSMGAKYKGEWAGSLATIGCTSFYPTKPLGCYGDGGMCFTDREELAMAMRRFQNHGQQGKYCHVDIGWNARLDTIQAAVLLAKLTVLETELIERWFVAAEYSEKLQDVGVRLPITPLGLISSWAQYAIVFDTMADRSAVIEVLNDRQIPYDIHYPAPLHFQPAIVSLGISGENLEVSEFLANHILSLPIHPYLSMPDINTVANAINYALCASSKKN